MFRAVIYRDGVKKLVRIVSAASRVSDSIYLWIDRGGIIIREMDPPRVCMINAEILAEFFSDYSYDGDAPVPVVLSSAKLIEFLKLMRSSEELSIEVSGGFLKLASKHPYEKSAMIPVLIDREKAMHGLPSVNYTAEFGIVLTSLIDILRNAKAIGDEIRLSAREHHVKFSAMSKEGHGMSVVLRYPDNLELTELRISEDSESRYMVAPIYGVLSDLSQLTRVAVVKFGSSMPMVIALNVAEGLAVEYYVAPKVTD